MIELKYRYKYRYGRVIALALLAAALILFETAAGDGSDGWAMPRTEHGQPDLQGVWFYGTATPFERPEGLGTQKSYSAAEAARLLESLAAAEVEKARPLDSERSAPEQGARIAQEADYNFASSRLDLIKLDGKYRTSQIVSPADGRLPFREGGKDFFAELRTKGHEAFDGPEIRPVGERCVGPTGGPLPPTVGWFYNANMQIIQTDSHVMILAEMNHDARIIPLTDQHRSNSYPQWMGNSIGHWEGDTLVVETVGFRPEQSWFAFVMSEELKVTERFRLTADDEIYYSYTFDDPKIYTEPVTVEKNIVRRAPGEVLYEYACHEGNYAMPSILAGARRQEWVGSE